MLIKESKDFGLVETFLERNFSSPTHWPDWNLCVSEEFDTDFYYLLAYQDNELIGVYPKHRERLKGVLFREFSGQYKLIPFGGWIFSRPINVSNGLMNYSKKILVNSLCYSLPEIPEFNVNLSNLSGDAMQTLAINLSNNLEDIWENELNGKRRNMIRKAERERIEILEDDLSEAIDNFYPIYEICAKRFTSFVLRRQFFESLILRSKNITLKIFSALHGNEIIANVVVIADKNFCFYWMGNNLNQIKNLGQGDLLQWAVIKSMKSFGCKYYDLCYIEPERLPAVYEFKRGFAKTAYPVFRISHSSFGYKIMNRIL